MHSLLSLSRAMRTGTLISLCMHTPSFKDITDYSQRCVHGIQTHLQKHTLVYKYAHFVMCTHTLHGYYQVYKTTWLSWNLLFIPLFPPRSQWWPNTVLPTPNFTRTATLWGQPGLRESNWPKITSFYESSYLNQFPPSPHELLFDGGYVQTHQGLTDVHMDTHFPYRALSDTCIQRRHTDMPDPCIQTCIFHTNSPEFTRHVYTDTQLACRHSRV